MQLQVEAQRTAYGPWHPATLTDEHADCINNRPLIMLHHDQRTYHPDEIWLIKLNGDLSLGQSLLIEIAEDLGYPINFTVPDTS